jgi:hypothetical protein
MRSSEMKRDGWDNSSAEDSDDRAADAERAPWRAPVITRFALERTLHTIGSAGDGSAYTPSN